jgi:hypothetical protein
VNTALVGEEYLLYKDDIISRRGEDLKLISMEE